MWVGAQILIYNKLFGLIKKYQIINTFMYTKNNYRTQSYKSIVELATKTTVKNKTAVAMTSMSSNGQSAAAQSRVNNILMFKHNNHFNVTKPHDDVTTVYESFVLFF